MWIWPINCHQTPINWCLRRSPNASRWLLMKNYHANIEVWLRKITMSIIEVLIRLPHHSHNGHGHYTKLLRTIFVPSDHHGMIWPECVQFVQTMLLSNNMCMTISILLETCRSFSYDYILVVLRVSISNIALVCVCVLLWLLLSLSSLSLWYTMAIADMLIVIIIVIIWHKQNHYYYSICLFEFTCHLLMCHFCNWEVLRVMGWVWFASLWPYWFRT